MPDTELGLPAWLGLACSTPLQSGIDAGVMTVELVEVGRLAGLLIVDPPSRQ